jgi:hypothetical protein
MRLIVVASVLMLASSCIRSKESSDAGVSLPTDEQIQKAIDALRDTSIEKEKTQPQDAQNVSSQIFFVLSRNPERARPLLVDAVQKELQSSAPNKLFLLDAVYLLSRLKSDMARVVYRVLGMLDAKSPETEARLDEIFLIAHEAARTGLPDILTHADRLFLQNETSISLAEIKLTPVEACLFIYGAQGSADQWLVSHLEHKHPASRRIAELAAWIGAPESAVIIERLVKETKSRDIFDAYVLYLLRFGGREGVKALKERLSDIGPEKTAVLKRYEKQIANANPDALTAELVLRQKENASLPDLREAVASRQGNPKLIKQLLAARKDAFKQINQQVFQYVEHINLAISIAVFR